MELAALLLFQLAAMTGVPSVADPLAAGKTGAAMTLNAPITCADVAQDAATFPFCANFTPVCTTASRTATSTPCFIIPTDIPRSPRLIRPKMKRKNTEPLMANSTGALASVRAANCRNAGLNMAASLLFQQSQRGRSRGRARHQALSRRHRRNGSGFTRPANRYAIRRCKRAGGTANAGGV